MKLTQEKDPKTQEIREQNVISTKKCQIQRCLKSEYTHANTHCQKIPNTASSATFGFCLSFSFLVFFSLSQLIIIVVICYHRQEKKLNKKREKGKFNQIEWNLAKNSQPTWRRHCRSGGTSFCATSLSKSSSNTSLRLTFNPIHSQRPPLMLLLLLMMIIIVRAAVAVTAGLWIGYKIGLSEFSEKSLKSLMIFILIRRKNLSSVFRYRYFASFVFIIIFLYRCI